MTKSSPPPPNYNNLTPEARMDGDISPDWFLQAAGTALSDSFDLVFQSRFTLNLC
jgi:hypothetical protein